MVPRVFLCFVFDHVKLTPKLTGELLQSRVVRVPSHLRTFISDTLSPENNQGYLPASSRVHNIKGNEHNASCGF